MQLTFDVQGLHGGRQAVAQPTFNVRKETLVRTLSVNHQRGLQTRGSLEALPRGIKEHQQRRHDQQESDRESADERGAIGRHALQKFLVQRVEKDGQHRRPRQWDEEWLEDTVDEIAEQQQRPVGKDGSQSVTGGLLSERSVAHARYIIRSINCQSAPVDGPTVPAKLWLRNPG